MEWLGEVLGVGASVASGGILGLVGSVASAFSKHAKEKQELKARRADYEHELKLLELQHSKAMSEDAQQIAMLQTEGSYAGLEASLQAEARTGDVSLWVNNIRSLTRPALTFGLVVVVTAMFFMLLNAIQSGTEQALVTLLGRDAVVELLSYIVYSCVFSATTAVVWWFGDRALTPPGYRSR